MCFSVPTENRLVSRYHESGRLTLINNTNGKSIKFKHFSTILKLSFFTEVIFFSQRKIEFWWWWHFGKRLNSSDTPSFHCEKYRNFTWFPSAFPQNFHTRNSGEITVFFAVSVTSFYRFLQRMVNELSSKSNSWNGNLKFFS